MSYALRNFCCGFVTITTTRMLTRGIFLEYNTKYIIAEQKENNDEPLLIFGLVDKTHCVFYNSIHGST
jgi:hypothetical protein